ncbi:methionine ABC transporter permease [Aquabacterium sp.]|jgi:D-methionine transport system permease protein|uniref:methionine ABC transporter permease n=1 Tax=Aquabacterium sp. TaxID=1872578 RepID=UPI0025C400F2|nr:methionine ABC transporter permease [Aquabacterium sp.]
MNEFDWQTLLDIDWLEIGQACLDTFTMLGVSLLFTVLIGLPVGVLLFLTAPGQLLARPRLYAVLSLLINVLRAVPFIILLIVMIPLTLKLVGTSLGVAGAIPPLIAASAPFFARLAENVFRDIDKGVIEASQAMGARLHQLVLGVLLPESLPGLIGATTVTAVTLVSYTAMSGVIGGGGLGDLAVRYGYQRFQTEVMVVTVTLMLVLVQWLQSAGDRLVRRFQRR